MSKLDTINVADLDAADELSSFRNQFCIPPSTVGDQIYFLGNSLGLQPRSLREYLDKVMNQWENYGVEAFFMGDSPWLAFHDRLTIPMAELVGAKPAEITIMNQLTVNLHLLMVSFYRPEGKKKKILCEQKAFPSDQYMLETHVKHLGLNPDDIIIEVAPQGAEMLFKTEDFLEVIEKHADELALIFLGGINYYTGQVLEMEKIAKAARRHNIRIGYDLAHAAGNIKLDLHQWDIDFAAWCTYKYLNAGPGGVGAVFIHERHHHNKNIPRFAGWFGYEKEDRFKMEKGFKPISTAEGWQLSTPSILLYASLEASLEIFKKAGWSKIQHKRKQMQDLLWELLQEVWEVKPSFTILTPKDNRGSQISLYFPVHGRRIYDGLMDRGIIIDWREPNVIRLAPVPLYNTFTDIHNFILAFKDLL